MQEIIRPAAEKRKIHSKNEFELCYIRHQYFRRVKYNPTKEEMAPYRSIIRHVAYRNYYTYISLFNTIGMNFDDIRAMGDIQLVNYLGLFELSRVKNEDKFANFYMLFLKKNGKPPVERDILNKNKANFTYFLDQRMEDFIRICKQKAKNIKGFRVDEYVAYVGDQEPPEETWRLIGDNETYGFRVLDTVAFKAIKKKAKAGSKPVFQFGGKWFVTVPLEHRNLTILDLAGAGLDPYESDHNLNPEQLMVKQEDQIRFDKQAEMFKNYSKEEKAKVLLDFIEKNSESPILQEEIRIARSFLRRIGVDNVRRES